MDYVKPADVVKTMIDAGRFKLSLSPRDLLIRGGRFHGGQGCGGVSRRA